MIWKVYIWIKINSEKCFGNELIIIICIFSKSMGQPLYEKRSKQNSHHHHILVNSFYHLFQITFNILILIWYAFHFHFRPLAMWRKTKSRKTNDSVKNPQEPIILKTAPSMRLFTVPSISLRAYILFLTLFSQ